MRRWLASVLAALTLFGPVLTVSANAAETAASVLPVSAAQATVPVAITEETTLPTTETTEHTPAETTAHTEETTATEATEATTPTEETVPVETTPATVSTTPAETVPVTEPETHPATEAPTQATEVTEVTETTEATEETQPAEEEPPKKSLWEMILEFLGLMEEDGALEAMSLSDAQGNVLALTPEFKPNCHTYGVQVPADGELTLTLEPGTDYQIYVNGTVLEDNQYAFTPQWDSQNFYQLKLTLLGKSLYDEDEYTLSLVLTPTAQTLEITQLPEKTEYQSGEAFDPTGLEVKVILSDGTTLVPKAEELTFSPAEALTAADTAITVQYADASAQIEVQVSGLEGDGSRSNPYLLTSQEDLFLLDEWVTGGEDQAGLYFQLMPGTASAMPITPSPGILTAKTSRSPFPPGARLCFPAPGKQPCAI